MQQDDVNEDALGADADGHLERDHAEPGLGKMSRIDSASLTSRRGR